jgi:hypothetical protein
MEAKAIQATRSKLNELANSHNKLTTLVAVMLSEIQALKEEMDAVKQMLDGVEVVSGDGSSAAAPATVHQAAPTRPNRVAPAVQPPPPPAPVARAPSSSSRGSRRNQSLADLHADDIIKQLSLNAD